jgi:hypothetical protein
MLHFRLLGFWSLFFVLYSKENSAFRKLDVLLPSSEILESRLLCLVSWKELISKTLGLIA